MTRWAVNRVTDPSVEALTTTEAKKHLRVEHTDEDTYIGSLSKTWREWVEDEYNMSLVKQTWDYFRDEFPDASDEPIELPRGPVISVSSVKYTTVTTTAAQTLSATTYKVDTASTNARVFLRDGESWPTDILRNANGVEVRYDAGFATSATGVPQKAKHALRLLVGSSYTMREAVVVGSINTKTELAVDSLVGSLDRRRYM